MSIFLSNDMNLLIEGYAPTLHIDLRLGENYPIQTQFVLRYITFLKIKDRCKVCEKYFFEWIFSSEGLNACPLYNNKKIEHIHI